MLTCRCCKQNRRFKTYYLYPDDGFIEEKIQRGYCPKCKKDLIKLFSIRKDGSKVVKEIFKAQKFLERRQIEREEFNLKPWKRANGFSYLKGYVKGDKGGVYSLSTDKKESEFKIKSFDVIKDGEVIKNFPLRQQAVIFCLESGFVYSHSNCYTLQDGISIIEHE
jgi:hypothetical protein